MQKTLFTLLLILTLGSVLPAEEGQQDKNRPNVVFILSDDQSWDSFGFMGGKVHTPRLNQMAKDGLYLRNFNVTSTVCSPSRYSFLTGRYAGRCEGQRFMREHPPGDQTQVENIGELETDRWNLAKVLQKNGYYTGFVGKSHVVRHDWIHPRKNNDAAMKVNWSIDADPRDPKINTLMREHHQRWCNEIKKYGFSFVDGVYGANLKELHNKALNVHNLDWTIDKTMKFLDSVDDKPFFLCVSTTLHHGPAPWIDKNALQADPRMTGEGFIERGFNVLPTRDDVLKRNREAGFKDRAAYALWLDDGVGAIIDKIKELGLSEETMIVFSPDHGAYRHGKTTLYDFGMRVPMLCLWPGTIEPGLENNEIIANIDFAPTVMDICGVKPPQDYRFDGMSFKAALNDDPTPLREVLLGELGHARCVKTKDWKYIAIRYPAKIQALIARGHKFNAYKDNAGLDLPYLTRNLHLGHFAAKSNPNYFATDQLYDLNSDPDEVHNIAYKHPEVVEMLKQKLAKELRQFAGRPFGEFTE
ncbi:MAG: sulfatase-like hydrolase/transferase [Mariniblastus sp.]|nr:sulfatase-like hydrolase/transferase [Mariniblastus sp.]